MNESTATTALAEFRPEFPAEQLEAVLRHYSLPAGLAVAHGGGSACPKAVLGNAPRRWLLKRRRKEFSAPEVVAFDHGVMQHLAAAGLPVHPPDLTRDGHTAVWHDGWGFELFRFVDGLTPFDPESIDHLVDAGAVLGRVHDATREFTPPGCKTWPREFHMGTNRRTLEAFLESAEGASASDAASALACRMLAEAQRVEAALPDDLYARLPAVIVHGDYTWANLGFRGPFVSGLFDFDWTCRQARLDEVARGVLFIAFPRLGPLAADTIRGLVAPWRPDTGRARRFLHAYERHCPLSDREWAVLPWAIRECWLGCRIRAMRKVPPSQRLEILTFGMDGILAGWDLLDGLSARGV